MTLQKKTQSKGTGTLTGWECFFIVEHSERGEPNCPDCEQGYLIKGPTGGASVNCFCNWCGSGYNICEFSIQMSHRISKNKNYINQTTVWENKQ